MKWNIRSIVFLLMVLNVFLIRAQEIVSPNKQLKVVLTENPSGQIFFSVMYKHNAQYIEALPASPLGILRKDQQFVEKLHFVKVSKGVLIHDKYRMITGKRKDCENFGTEKVFSYINADNQPLDIVFRVYNDGVAFRYVFPNHSDSLMNILSESTAYVLPNSTSRWTQPYSVSYEGFYQYNTTGKIDKNGQQWGLPLLFKVNGRSLWGLIAEADITGSNNAVRLTNAGHLNKYAVMYPPGRKDFHQTGVISSLPWQSQWHVLIIGDLSDIVESTLVTDVSAPDKLKDTKWIRPGAVAWVYWAYNHGSKDYKKVIQYIDLAVNMHWPYVLIDWEWDQMSNGGSMVDAVNYAKQKGIKPLLWYNSGTDWLGATPTDRLLTHEKRVKEFKWLNKIGVYGIKVDFFAGDQQDMIQYYIDILKDAAIYHLMVNFHGATVPTGWSRTYPNLMTMEAVYGAEWYNNGPVLTKEAARHNVTLPFTRNVIGPMDYTPVTFSNSQNPHTTSFGHELALSVVFESGLQHFADRPSAYESLPAGPIKFLQTVPVSWDDTKFIDGYPGRNVVIARKKGNKWYIGGLNGMDTAQTLGLNFDFLPTGRYTLHLIEDGKTPTTFLEKSTNVQKEDILKVDCLGRGGFVGVIESIK